MTNYFTNKIIIITGSSSGIGLALTQQLLDRGAVVIGCSRSLTYSKQLVSKYPDTFIPIQVDITNTNDINHLKSLILKQFHKIDILINNAGIGLPKLFKDTNLHQVVKIFDTNFFSLVRIIKTFLPLFTQQKSGHIVNIASIAGKTVSTHNSIYGASKYAVIGFSDHLRREVEELGIKVLVVNPTFVNTPFFEKNPTYLEKFGHHTKLVGLIPPERMARKILQAIESGKDDLTYPFLANLYSKIHAISPNLAKLFA